MLALTHIPSPLMQQCQLTYLDQQRIDPDRAAKQHEAYCQMLRQCDVDVRVLEMHADFPDCVFIEDTAIILDEIAILASMGAKSRRKEPLGLEPVLHEYREVQRIGLPARIEGGDVLVCEKTLLVGISTRTDTAGAHALAEIVRPLGYRVVPIPVRDCLHLKTACCALPDGRLLVNPAWIELTSLPTFTLLEVPEDEPWGANLVVLGEQILLAAEHPRTASMLADQGFPVHSVELSEFAKAEGGATCLSLLIRNGPPAIR